MRHYKIELISNLYNLTCQKINHLMLEWEEKSLEERLDQTAKIKLKELSFLLMRSFSKL